MLSTARKYGVEFDGIYFSPETLDQIPLWHHIGGDPKKIQYNNRGTDVCLQTRHKALTIGDAVDIARRSLRNEHLPSKYCECIDCLEDANQGCLNPHSCVKEVTSKLDQLLPKWDP
ncbi:hypothetical protein C8J56DRAFT_721052, partial [Mycena floridula]